MISTTVVSAIQANIINSNFTSTSSMGKFPSLPGLTPPITPIVINEANTAGQYFVSRGTHQHPHSDSISIASVSINGRP